MENQEITIVENNLEVASQSAKKKTNKKGIIISAVIAVVIIGIVASIIVIVSNSNSLWKKPFDEESYQYGYSVTLEEFVAKVNECDFGSGEYEYYDMISNDDYDMYQYLSDASFLNVAYYPDNTIRGSIVSVPFNANYPFRNICLGMGEEAVRILYAYNAFGKNISEDDMIDISDIFEEAFKDASEYQSNFYRYDDFVININNSNPDSDSGIVGMAIGKYDEESINNLEQKGANIIDLTE